MTLAEYSDKEAAGKLFICYNSTTQYANLYIVEIRTEIEEIFVRGCYWPTNKNGSFMSNLNSDQNPLWTFNKEDICNCVEADKIGLMFIYSIIQAIAKKQ